MYYLNIEPMPAQRARYAKRGKHVKVYHTEAYQAYLDRLRSFTFENHFDCLVKMSITFFCKKAKTSKLTTPKGDIDNYIKGFLDGIQPKLITDDKQVVAIYAEKKFSDDGKGYIHFQIEEFS